VTDQMIQLKVINKSRHALPAYQTPGSAGMDIYADLEASVTIAPLQRVIIPTGLFMEIPRGYEVQIRPRSGMAIKNGITVINAPGTIDSDYRGEVKVGLVNLSDTPYTVEDGERIAQMVLAKHETAVWQEVETLEASDRGAGGFGHTGIKK